MRENRDVHVPCTLFREEGLGGVTFEVGGIFRQFYTLITVRLIVKYAQIRKENQSWAWSAKHNSSSFSRLRLSIISCTEVQ